MRCTSDRSLERSSDGSLERSSDRSLERSLLLLLLFKIVH